ncbi:hypothetical protein [Bacillus sp. WP8]|uniref:hypothetical protein n=1 Tax=Bacillus sp. WP8 TaxID=756828 RepID=UPI0011A318C6|nr:hypothetical protein [Bacillus sp. WP8]
MDTTMSIYAHVIEEADQKSAIHFDSFFDTNTEKYLKINPLPTRSQNPVLKRVTNLSSKEQKSLKPLIMKGFRLLN